MSSDPPSSPCRGRGSAALRPNQLASPGPNVNISDAAEVAAALATYKRQLASLSKKLDEATQATPPAKRPITHKTMGRGIRKIVTLFDNLSCMLNEADRRTFEGPAAKDPTQQHRLDRIYRAYPLFIQLVPHFRTLAMVQGPEGVDAVNTFLTKLQEGANNARSDDVRRIKEEVADCINARYRPATLLQKTNRDNRGLQHDVCGGLLTPLMYDWNDLDVRAKIRGSKPGYIISSNYYLTCLYAKDTIFNPRRIEVGFLRSDLLLTMYHITFTSPSSAESLKQAIEHEQSAQGEPPFKKVKTSPKATKSCVSSLLNMDGKVTPRSIAYVAVLLVFNLTEASTWTESHNNFSFVAFYNFIIDYFEEERDAASTRRAGELLEWWNQQIFPEHVSAVTDSDESRNMLLDQDDY
ncbi:hypothetical protein BDN70DRAFT_900887 [Pholiota conissans]|uniref:Uncharacterized protein n=1 Tax=Pholiota conissans TaxID=109636 RepID=A0A9P6CM82_9AGAR|nr:hypothetical protein BDN70DRAFT_900887 [Pholiota conissans]